MVSAIKQILLELMALDPLSFLSALSNISTYKNDVSIHVYTFYSCIYIVHIYVDKHTYFMRVRTFCDSNVAMNET